MSVTSFFRTRWFAPLLVAAIVAPLSVFWAPWLMSRYYVHRAAAALARFETDRALDWLVSAERGDEGNAEMHFLKARAFRRKGKFDEMAQHLDQAFGFGYSAVRIERERRLSVAQTGRVHDVQPYLPEMLTSPGEDGPEICASFVSGFCLSYDFEPARELLDAWTADFPDDPEPHSRRGDLWFAQNEWKEAVAAYRQCLDRDSSRTSVRVRLAECLLRSNEPAEAETHFRRCVSETPDSIDARSGLGTCLMTLGKTAEARKALLFVVERAPQNFEARKRLGELELSVGHPEEALKWIRPLAENWPDDSFLATIMAQALQETGHVEQARPYWEAVRRAEEAITRIEKLTKQIREHPTDVALRYEIGMYLMRYRSREEGAGWLKSLLQYDPRHREAHAALAKYYAIAGEADLAAYHRQWSEVAEKPRDQ